MGINITQMVTCYLEYTIDPLKLKDFKAYAKKWIPLVNRFGGNHHGYFLPHEGLNNKAYALFSFPTLVGFPLASRMRFLLYFSIFFEPGFLALLFPGTF